MQKFKIVALNFGSTSSKVAYFEDEQLIVRETIEHPISELQQFAEFFDQRDYRVQAILQFMKQNHIEQSEVDAFVCWGGHCEPVTGGIYRITPKFMDEVKSMKYGHHPGDLAPLVAYALANQKALAITVDPPTIDEFDAISRYTGIKEITRKSRMQTLNQKAVAKQYAKDTNQNYEDINLVVCHMGGGISVVSHVHGKMVDANNGLDGDGPMASNRSGTVPAGDLIALCFSGNYTQEEIKQLVTGKGGLVNLLGESDSRVVEKRIAEGDTYAKEVYDAMIYQIAKQIGAASIYAKGQIDAILLTGGVANSKYVSEKISEYVSFIAPVKLYPGELEMVSLGQSAYRALTNQEAVKEI